MYIVYDIFSLITSSHQTCWMACDFVHAKDLFHNSFFKRNPRSVDVDKLDIFISVFIGSASPGTMIVFAGQNYLLVWLEGSSFWEHWFYSILMSLNQHFFFW